MLIEILDPSGRGGIHYYAQSLAASVAGLGHAVEVVTASDAEWSEPVEGVTQSRCLEGFARPTRLPGFIRRARSAASHAHNCRLVLARMGHERCDVAHFVWPPLMWADWCVARVASRRPTVVTVHNVLPHDSRSTDERDYWARIYGAADVLVCHSDATVDDLANQFGPAIADNAIVIPHPVGDPAMEHTDGLGQVESRSALDLPEDAFIILSFGAMRPYKGLPTLLDALPALLEAVPRARLLIAGTCDEWDVHRAHIERNHIEAAVIERVGWIDRGDIGLYFSAADVAALPYTHIDGSGVAAVAASFGTPMVMSDIQGFRAVWSTDEVTYVSGGPEAWARALADAADMPPSAGERAHRARDRARLEMTWQISAERHIVAYELAIARFAERQVS